MEPELLSVGRESVVWREGDFILKSYAPEQHHYFSDSYKAVFGDEADFQQSPTQRTPTRLLRESYFRRESRLLEALSKIIPQYLFSNPFCTKCATLKPFKLYFL